MRLRELGFEVRRVIKRQYPPTSNWEVYLRFDYDGLSPIVDTLRERLRLGLHAMGYRCPKAKIRVRLRGSRLMMSFPWP